MCNPNNNAILFLFFAAFFMPKRKFNISNDLVFYLSFALLLLTQSRTGMIAFIAITISNIFINSLNYKMVLRQLMVFIALFIVVNISDYFDYNYRKANYEKSDEYHIRQTDTTIFRLFHGSKYLTNIVESDRSETFITGRLESWKYLWGMVKKKPLIGYGPNKDFFYEKRIYPESQYMLVLWRYGFIGLTLFLMYITLPILKRFNTIPWIKTSPYILFVMVILITGLTNTPISEPRILLFFAFATAYWFHIVDNKKLQNEETSFSR
jgi:O-antigen ligase